MRFVQPINGLIPYCCEWRLKPCVIALNHWIPIPLPLNPILALENLVPRSLGKVYGSFCSLMTL